MQGLWLLLLPIAATCGWITGRNSKTVDKSTQHSNLRRDYFAGLNYVLNEQPDKAVDVFIKLLEVDSDTVETHLALGSLFRRKGEVDRAIRIHQNLIARSQLDPTHRLHALYALAQDYLKAGMLDRAERLFLELSTAKLYRVESLHCLMKIYQQEREWSKAIEIAKQLRSSSREPVNIVIAQYSCELAEKLYAEQKYTEAEHYLKEALYEDSLCVRATLIQAKILEKLGDFLGAIKAYQEVELQNPEFLSEVVQPLARCYGALEDSQGLINYLYHCVEKYPSMAAGLVSAQFIEHQVKLGVDLNKLNELFVNHSSLSAVERMLSLYETQAAKPAQPHYALLRKMVAKLLTRKNLYRCSHCGLAGKMLHWQCPGCQQWAKVKPILLESE
ncbi:MAG TPA: lipopolysaccharide assembly protein LapB [Coxiellaceae bacterium]|nr:lipopolysaccharide assembly protein LapB [Coxiellaceae bacterium]